MSTIHTRGVNFHVQRLGHGPPVVMLHGLLSGSIATWGDTIAPRLTDLCAPILIDQRGHGASTRPRHGYGATELAHDLEAVTRHLPAFPLVAHGYGCLVAVRFALANPYRVLGLTLVEPPFALSLDPNLDITVLGQGSLSPAPADQARALLEGTDLQADLEAEPELTDDDLAALRGDLLVVFGDQSPCRTGEVLVRRNRPDAWVVVLPGGHHVHEQSTDALTDVVRRQLIRALEIEVVDPSDAPRPLSAGPIDAGGLLGPSPTPARV